MWVICRDVDSRDLPRSGNSWDSWLFQDGGRLMQTVMFSVTRLQSPGMITSGFQSLPIHNAVTWSDNNTLPMIQMYSMNWIYHWLPRRSTLDHLLCWFHSSSILWIWGCVWTCGTHIQGNLATSGGGLSWLHSHITNAYQHWRRECSCARCGTAFRT